MSTAAASSTAPGDPVAQFRAVAEKLAELTGAELWRLSGEQVEEILTIAQAVGSNLDRIEVHAVREGVQRGLHSEQGYGVVDWISAAQARSGLAPDPARVLGLKRMSEAGDRSAAQPIYDRFLAGELSLLKADQLARFERDVSRVADPSEFGEQLDALIEAAADDDGALGLTPRELASAMTYAGLLFKRERLADEEADALRRGRPLIRRQGPAGLTEYRLRLEPEGSAFLDAALAELSGPVPEPDGEPDPRPADRRRADALVAIVKRGVAEWDGQASSTRGQVVVTMIRSDLEDALAGAGVTATGQVLPADVLRRMACDAGIIPVVLGSDGEPLDVGRSERLFTPAQRKAMFKRDGGCTFPNCTIPPQWCEAHHVVWWSLGGKTDLSNGALLCEQHHHLVHRRYLTAEVTSTGVTWDLSARIAAA